MRDDEPTHDGHGPGAFDGGDTLPAESAIAPPSASPSSSPALRVGTQVGRYLLEEELGRGGMGVVYAAFDPELDRHVAIKLLRTSAVEGTEGRARLQREAQALARLAHPNVINVFDVGSAGDEVFVAMELSGGGTLRAWQESKSWRDVVAAYLQAGRGLAAAHAAGLVHRDFKPDNVLVGEDGRLRVTDFGLVRAAAGAEAAPAPTRRDTARLRAVAGAATLPLPTRRDAGRARVDTASAREPDALPPSLRAGLPRADSRAGLSSDLTVAGSVMGTPMYMAPEQVAGATLTPAADQFAFSVALWMALHGEPPFAADQIEPRLEQIQRGQRQAAKQRAVPVRVNRVITRGLAYEPAARWPSLDVMLARLERAARPRTRAVVVGAGAVAVIGAATLWIGLRGGAASPCADAAAGADPWTSRRPAVEAAFVATGAPFAADAFAFVDRRLGGFEGELRAQRVTACRDSRERKLQTIGMLELRQACLGARRHGADALIDGLARADRALIERVDQVMAALPRLDACADLEALAGQTPRPRDPAVAAAVAAVEQQLAAVDAELDVVEADSDRSAARAAASAAREAADRLAYAPLQAEVRLVIGHAARLAGDVDGARQELVEAAAAATRGHDRQRLAEAYLALFELDSEVRADRAGAEQWSQLAGAAVDALGAPVSRRAELVALRAELARNRGEPRAAATLLEGMLAEADLPATIRRELLGDFAQVQSDLGEYGRAEQLFDELIPLWTRELGDEHPAVLTLRANRANQLYFRGDFGRCRDAHRELLAARERVLGPEHRATALSLQALGVCEDKAGDAASGRAHLERAVAILRARRGPEHPDTLAAMSDLGGAFSHQGDHAAALALNQELLTIRERVLDADHPELAVSLINTAIEAKHAGQVELALDYHTRALGIFERSLGADHPNVGIALVNFGEALRAAGRPADAIARFEQAGRVLTAALGEDHVLLAHVWYGLGQAELARGRARPAVAWLERAVARRRSPDLDRNEVAEAKLALAQALIAAGGDRARARELASDAIALWAGLGAELADERAAAAAWLAKQQP